MDRRYKPLSPAETLAARRALAQELAAQPATPIPVVIRRIRTALRLTIAEYAKLCGVSARALADIEREATSPTLATVDKLLRPMGWVLGAVVATPADRFAQAAEQPYPARPDTAPLLAAQERSRIDTNAPWELDYWSEALGVPREQLIAAVEKAGPTVADVRRYLGK